ncbi:hypothetical protein BH09MYX1_BH09MYX1_38910 [soil metagenome]
MSNLQFSARGARTQARIGIVVVVAACGGATSDLATTECVEGRRTQCACHAAADGYAVCGADGAFGACHCPDPVDAGALPDAPPPDAAAPPFDIEFPKECERKENTFYITAEPGSGGYPPYAESPNPGFSTVVRFHVGARPEGEAGVGFDAEPSGSLFGGPKVYIFSLRNLKTKLVTGVVYDNTVEDSDYLSSNPVEDVRFGCTFNEKRTGRFIFHSLEWKTNVPDPRPARFLVAFERRCSPSKPAVRGCLHYDENNPQ